MFFGFSEILTIFQVGKQVWPGARELWKVFLFSLREGLRRGGIIKDDTRRPSFNPSIHGQVIDHTNNYTSIDPSELLFAGEKKKVVMDWRGTIRRCIPFICLFSTCSFRWAFASAHLIFRNCGFSRFIRTPWHSN